MKTSSSWYVHRGKKDMASADAESNYSALAKARPILAFAPVGSAAYML